MKLHTGTIISGTLRQANLLDAFANTLALHDHHNNKKLIDEAHLLVKFFGSGTITNEVQYQIVDEVLVELTEALNKLCPAYHYFGPAPDDPTDFGVWWEEGDRFFEDWNEMMTGYEQWLDDQASKADWEYQFAKEKENE